MSDEGHTEHEAADLDRQARTRAQDLRRTIEFGIAVEALLDGPIGQRMLADCDAERLALMEEAVRVDVETPEGFKRQRDIRHEVAVIDQWQQLFARYISEGKDAEVQFLEGEVSGE